MNAWLWWQQALEHPKEIGQPHLMISDGDPQQGFYKVRWPGQPWEPVAIWKDGDQWIALRNGKPVDAMEIWTWVCRHPITAEAYERALTGNGWADDDPTVAAMLGHNVGDLDDYETLKDQIDSAEAGAESYKGISNDEQAERAQSLRARLNELAGQADKLREALKKPHFEAAKAVDTKWMPLVKSAKAIADMIRREIEAFKTAQLRELRRLEEERRRAEQARLEEEERLREEIRAAEAAGLTPVVPPAPEPLPPPPPPIETTVKGNYGRAASMRTKVVVTGISDEKALVYYLQHGQQREALFDALIRLAQKQVDAGMTVPGVTTEEKAVMS